MKMRVLWTGKVVCRVCLLARNPVVMLYPKDRVSSIAIIIYLRPPTDSANRQRDHVTSGIWVFRMESLPSPRVARSLMSAARYVPCTT